VYEKKYRAFSVTFQNHGLQNVFVLVSLPKSVRGRRELLLELRHSHLAAVDESDNPGDPTSSLRPAVGRQIAHRGVGNGTGKKTFVHAVGADLYAIGDAVAELQHSPQRESSVPYHFLGGVELAPQTCGTGVKEGVLRHEAPFGHSRSLGHQPWCFERTCTVFDGMERACRSDGVNVKRSPKNVVDVGMRQSKEGKVVLVLCECYKLVVGPGFFSRIGSRCSGRVRGSNTPQRISSTISTST